MRTWYQFKNADKADGEVEILIYDQIGVDWWTGEGVEAKQFIEDLKQTEGRDLFLRINSPGGDVWDGAAIYNSLLGHSGNIRVSIDGIALSMASVIAMAGDTVQVPENSMMMVHNPWAGAIGDSAELRRIADLLDQSRVGLVSAYRRKSKMTAERIGELMDAETWFTGPEAVEAGLADEVVDGVQLAAAFDRRAFSGFRNTPEAVEPMIFKDTPEPSGIQLSESPRGRKVAIERRRLWLARRA